MSRTSMRFSQRVCELEHEPRNTNSVNEIKMLGSFWKLSNHFAFSEVLPAKQTSTVGLARFASPNGAPRGMSTHSKPLDEHK